MKPSQALHHHRQAILDIIARHHATNPRVFGSVLHGQDHEGSDLDILIEPKQQDPAALIEAKLALLRDLHQTLGDQKIDIIIHRTSSTHERPIHRIARQTGIQLA